MVKCSFGMGTSEDVSACVDEAVKDFKNPKLIMFFAGETHFKEYAKTIGKMFPKAVCIGCSAYRMWDYHGSDKDVLKAVAIEDGITCSAGIIENADNFALEYSDSVKYCLEEVGETENTVCVEFTIPYKRSEEFALMALNSVLLREEIPIIGGTAANSISHSDENEESFISLNGKVYTKGCVFVLIHNVGGGLFFAKENIYEPLTGNNLVATKASSVTRTVMALNHIPAAEAYAKELGVPTEKISDYFFHYPLARQDGNDIFITALQSEGSNGSIKTLARVYEGTDLMVMKEGDYKRITRETIADIKKNVPDPSFVIAFNCVARSVLFEEIGYVEEYGSLLAEAFPNYIGFSCLGEQLGTKHFNHTMLFLVFE